MSIISKVPFNLKLNWREMRSEPEVGESGQSPSGISFIKLIVGLGNIGDEFTRTRHNIGFDIVDAYAKQEGFPPFKNSKKFFGLVSEKFVGGQKIILLKPTTLVNLSGKSVRSIKEFYNIPTSDITIIHDELDLEFGTVKLKVGGEGKSSHNGLKDIANKLGETDFRRIRFGIKNPLLKMIETKNYVLSIFNKDEQAKLKKLIKESLSLI